MIMGLATVLLTVFPTASANANDTRVRKVLIDLYDNCNGVHWVNKGNWKSEASICDWAGIHCSPFSLSLSANPLNCMLPSELGMIELTSLTLRANNINGTIPPQLFSPPMKDLDLSSNSLTGTIPPVHQQQLRTLYLNSNYLTGTLPEEIFTPYLQGMNLAQNYFTGSVSAAGSRDLGFLRLSDNQFTGSIPNLSLNPDITTLILENNAFQGAIEGWIWNMTKLNTIALSTNQLTSIAPVSFPPKPKPANMMINVDFSNNRINGSIPAFFSNVSIGYLNLNNNNFSGELNHLFDSGNKLIKLSIAGNNFTGAVSKFCHNASTDLLISALDISRINTTISLAMLMRCLSHFPYLSSLNASDNPIRGTSSSFLSQRRLESLDLSKTLITELQPHDLFQISPILRELRMYDTNLTAIQDVSELHFSVDRLATDPTTGLLCPDVMLPGIQIDIKVDARYYNYQGCTCPTGFYWAKNASACYQCPDFVDCDGLVHDSNLRFKRGFYPFKLVRGNETPVFCPNVIPESEDAFYTAVKCDFTRTCNPNQDLDYNCLEGFDENSFQCGRCASGYFRSSRRCLKCPRLGWVISTSIIYPLILFSAFWISSTGVSRGDSVAIGLFYFQLSALLRDSGDDSIQDTNGMFTDGIGHITPLSLDCIWPSYNTYTAFHVQAGATLLLILTTVAAWHLRKYLCCRRCCCCCCCCCNSCFSFSDLEGLRGFTDPLIPASVTSGRNPGSRTTRASSVLVSSNNGGSNIGFYHHRRSTTGRSMRKIEENGRNEENLDDDNNDDDNPRSELEGKCYTYWMRFVSVLCQLIHSIMFPLAQTAMRTISCGEITVNDPGSMDGDMNGRLVAMDAKHTDSYNWTISYLNQEPGVPCPPAHYVLFFAGVALFLPIAFSAFAYHNRPPKLRAEVQEQPSSTLGLAAISLPQPPSPQHQQLPPPPPPSASSLSSFSSAAASSSSLQEVLGFLWAPLHRKYWWWKIGLITFRKLAVSILAAFFSHDGKGTSLSVLLLLMSGVLVHVAAKPYHFMVDNMLEAASLSAASGIYLARLLTMGDDQHLWHVVINYADYAFSLLVVLVIVGVRIHPWVQPYIQPCIQPISDCIYGYLCSTKQQRELSARSKMNQDDATEISRLPTPSNSLKSVNLNPANSPPDEHPGSLSSLGPLPHN